MDRDTQIAKSKAVPHARHAGHGSRITVGRPQGQFADDRTKKGMEKISAVVDSGAEANAIPEKVTQRIPLKPQSRARCSEDPEEVPSIQKKRSVTGRTDEGQRRRIVWERFAQRSVLS